MVAQCPACARFLSDELVSGLSSADGACPRCGTALDVSMFDSGPNRRERGVPGDPLAGWDRQRAAERPLTGGIDPGSGDRATVAGGLLLGVVLGGTLGRRRGRPVVGGLVGSVVGGLAAASSRGIWTLEY